ncbi:DegT/DnrJ/EryC1/StrS family aminotransferase [Chondromyces crocatus]|uniref:Aminotransferase DegT n=1 Tax=Chondromyces crocatus TaxID=52 RepID=A0A0K1EEG7_CHOCO|nr:DegT/DnrJ/EryC1/StrS family aminotransferase [Chondromyces crocatus]AKT39067.1 aminotransferase DegT [Chondromyces crocatus]
MGKSMWKVPLSDLTFGPEEKEAALRVLDSGWLTMGEHTLEFERRLGEALGTPRTLAVTNCTVALHLAYAALGVGPGDEVICPSLTFVATANAALLTGATVVLADVLGEHDLSIDPEDIARKITPKTRAIAVVHYAGYPCDMDAIRAIAAERRVAIVEDVAHGPLARWRGQALGTLGDVGCFSFFSNKNLAVGEGGAITSKDDSLHSRMRLLRSHGMTTLTLDRHKGHAFTYDVVEAGMNYRIDELRSAIGVIQLERLPEGNRRRREITERYHTQLASIAGLQLPYKDFYARGAGESAHHIMPVLLPEGVQRQAVMERMKANGIQTSVHYPPIHQFSHHGASERVRRDGLDRTDAIAPRELTLPLYPRMRDGDVDLVCEALAASLR